MKYKFFTLLLVNLISFNNTACAYTESLCREWQIDRKKIDTLSSATESVLTTVSTGSALELKDILKRLEPEVDFSSIGGAVNTLVKMPPSKDNLEKLEILIEYGFQVNSLDLKTGQTPLTTIISKSASIKSIDALLTHPFIDLDKPDRNGLTPLHLATYTCPAIVDTLLAHGALYFTHQKSAKDRTTIKNINLDSLVRNNIKYGIQSIIAKHQKKRLENKEFVKTPYSRYLDKILSNPVKK